MKTPNYNTLAFIRYYFHIPVSCKLSWGLIEETLNGKTEIRLGVALLNRPNFYIDVAMRRFFTETELFGGGLVRKVHASCLAAVSCARCTQRAARRQRMLSSIPQLTG